MGAGILTADIIEPWWRTSWPLGNERIEVLSAPSDTQGWEGLKEKSAFSQL